jgi:hypothetical protein
MGPKHVSMFVVSALLLAWAGSAAADQYRADEFFGLDLSKAVLSPKRLGPPAQFAPVAVEARSDAARTRIEPKVVRSTAVRATKVTQVKEARAEKPRAEKPRTSARAKVVRRHSNPLDAQAMDTRIQKWPCKSGGICDWKR